MPTQARRFAPILRLAPAILLGLGSPSIVAADGPPDSAPVVFKADFEGGTLDGWDFTDPAAWRLADRDGGKALELFRASQYKPEVRSPFNIALAPGVEVGDFVLDVRARSTKPDYNHRDLCFIFGHRDPSHFYYVHLAKAADPHANSIFLVNGAPRVTIAETRTDGTTWTEGWHHVRIEREVESGLIRVFFDDMTKSVMVAHDRTFGRGRVGLGSFDDIGQFDDLTIRSPDRGATPE